MTDLPQYIVAKYAADVARLETRNIGVLVWHRGHTASRFLELAEADFVEDKALLQRWVRFWKDQAAQPQIRVGRRKPVPRSAPGFVDEL